MQVTVCSTICDITLLVMPLCNEIHDNYFHLNANCLTPKLFAMLKSIKPSTHTKHHVLKESHYDSMFSIRN